MSYVDPAILAAPGNLAALIVYAPVRAEDVTFSDNEVDDVLIGSGGALYIDDPVDDMDLADYNRYLPDYSYNFDDANQQFIHGLDDANTTYLVADDPERVMLQQVCTRDLALAAVPLVTACAPVACGCHCSAPLTHAAC